MEQSNNLKLPLIDVNNAEDLKITFINFVKMICGVDDSSALQILDKTIKNLQNTKQDTLTAGENITIVNNVISGQGGVEEEDVMDIIENNAEQTNTLDIGTSETFDATSDDQIPTSKAVSDLMASAGGGSKLYRHYLSLKYNSNFVNCSLITSSNEVYTTNTLAKYLYDNGCINANNAIALSIYFIKNSKINFVEKVYSTDGSGVSGYSNELTINIVPVENSTNEYTTTISTSSTIGIITVNKDTVTEL